MRRVAQTITGLAVWSAVDAQPPLDAAALLASIRRRLNSPAVLRGDFQQMKKLSGFKRPVVSRGNFILARDLGMVWHTATPFASTLTMTHERLRTSFDGASEPIDERQDPGFSALSATLMALMAGDMSVLMRTFRVTDGAEDARGWRLSLFAQDAVLARVFERVEMHGAQYVDEVRLYETSGDDSTLQFSAHHATALTSDERALFE
jgi:Outer membrane lipoprotein carrier protein LolA-like